jgi:hypothetical protein
LIRSKLVTRLRRVQIIDREPGAKAVSDIPLVECCVRMGLAKLFDHGGMRFGQLAFALPSLLS